MAFKTNPAIEEWEKKHTRITSVISFVLPMVILLIGIYCLIADVGGDPLVPIFMIVVGVLGVICAIALKSRKD